MVISSTVPASSYTFTVIRTMTKGRTIETQYIVPYEKLPLGDWPIFEGDLLVSFTYKIITSVCRFFDPGREGVAGLQ